LKPLFLEAWSHPLASRPDYKASVKRLNDWVGSFSLRLLLIAAKAKVDLIAATPR
jgi:hypothetical protein